MKTCRRCKKEFENIQDYFHKDRLKADGLSIYCKACSKKYRKETREKIKQRNKSNKNHNFKGGIPKSRLHGTQYKLGQLYEIETTENERARRKVKGKVIQETNSFIVIESKSGVRECFLKRDFYLGDTIKEL